MMGGLSIPLLLRCFLRTYVVGAAYNPRGLQNIGFTFALEPGLMAIYGRGKALRNARLRYARHYNCHPFLTPWLLGVYLRMEADINRGVLAPQVLVSLKDTTANALSGIGDSFFSGSLMNTWALTMTGLILSGQVTAALAASLISFILLQFFKLTTFFMGFSRGIAFLSIMKRVNLINWSERLKCINAVLLVWVLWSILPQVGISAWGGVALYLLLAGWLIGKVHVPRIFVAILLLVLAVALHLTDMFGQMPALWSVDYEDFIYRKLL